MLLPVHGQALVNATGQGLVVFVLLMGCHFDLMVNDILVEKLKAALDAEDRSVDYLDKMHMCYSVGQLDSGD